MNRLIAWFAENNKVSNLLMLCIMAGGFLSLPTIEKEFFPTPTSRTIQINTLYPGAAPINVEEQVCIRIENSIQDLDGIDEMATTAHQGLCQMLIRAEDSYDVAKLTDDIKSRVDAISSLPKDAERPQVSLLTTKNTAMFISLEGNLDEQALKQTGKTIQKDLESLPFVASVNLDGVRDYEISIELKQRALQRYQLTLPEIKRAIRASSLDIPAGKINSEQGDIRLQVRNQAYTAAEFAPIVIRKTPSGAILRLEDIATITDGFVENHSLAWVNGLPAVFLEVHVSDNPDILKTNQVVSDYIAAKNQSLPDGVQLKILFNLADMFKDRANTLIKNGMGGLILVFIVLMLFLRPLLALWVCIGIGIAFLGAFWLMPLFSTSLNMMSLFAFLMILGIVVDDAIIVCESIYSEQEKKGLGIQTAIRGAQSVSKPVVYAVISTMLVFVPMLLLTGSASEAIQSLPIVILLCLFFSLVECLFILPSHLAHMPKEGYFQNPLARLLDRTRQHFSNALKAFTLKVYQPVLAFCLNHTLPTIAAFLAALMIVLSIFIGGWIKFSFLPDVTTDFIEATITLPAGESEGSKTAVAKQLENSINALQKNTVMPGTDMSSVTDHIVWVEGNAIKSLIFVNNTAEGALGNADISRRWHEYMGDIRIAKTIDFNYKLLDSGKPIQLVLSGESKAELAAAGEALKSYLKAFKGTYDISDSFDLAPSEIALTLKPEQTFTGWDIELLAQQLRSAFYGTEVQRIPRDGEDIKVMLRLDKMERIQPDSLRSLPVTDSMGNLTRLDAVADAGYHPSEVGIKRLDRKRSLVVSAALQPDTSSSIDIIKDVMTHFSNQLAMDYPGVDIRLQGEEKERQEFVAEWFILFLQALMAIYVIMVIAFKSYWQPIIILTAIPFGAMGAILGHLIMGVPVSSYSFFGILACAGVVVNDNLVLIDRINQLYQQGMPMKAAAFQAGMDRFRPIILTSATTFIGLIPIMSETSIQAQFLIPMVISLAYGVLFATAVTLLLVPCLYLSGEGASETISRWRFHRKELKQ